MWSRTVGLNVVSAGETILDGLEDIVGVVLALDCPELLDASVVASLITPMSSTMLRAMPHELLLHSAEAATRLPWCTHYVRRRGNLGPEDALRTS